LARGADTSVMVEEAAATSLVARRSGRLRRPLALARGAETHRSLTVAARAALISCLVVWITGWVAQALFGHFAVAVTLFDPDRVSEPFRSGTANLLVGPAARWDAVWYLQVAHWGYYHFGWTPFFPLYPMLIHLGAAVVGHPLLVGLLISVFSMLVGLTLLHRLALLDVGERTAGLSVMLVALFPMALFLSTDYTESLYLMLSVGAVYAARRDRWVWAGVLGGLASATRSNGVLILIPLVLLYLYGPRRRAPSLAPGPWWKPRYRPTLSAAWLALVPAGLGAYLGYLAIKHGAPLAPFQAVKIFWGRSFTPFAGLVRAIGALPGDLHRLLIGRGHRFVTGDPVTGETRDLINFSFLVVGVVALIASWRRVPFAYLAYAAALIFAAVSFPPPTEPLQSLPRYLLVAFPLFIGAASRLRPRRDWTVAVLCLSTALLVVFSGFWATWTWVS
jgi:Mannosyltransferase (PIG-V)